MKAKVIKVFGLVQGVGYRAFISRVAESLKINGFVRNRQDGSVYIEAEGDDDEIEQFLIKCNKGPAWSKVIRVEEENTEMKGYSGFQITR